MKILFISDTHNNHPVIYREWDAIFHIGDATNSGSLKEFECFNRWWYSLEAKYKVFIPGNHEFYYFKEIQHSSIKEANIKFGLTDAGVITLINESLELNGIKFYGSPNTKPVNEKIFWAWEEQEENRKNIFSSIPCNIDFLLTHTPPSKTLSFNSQREDCGCPILLEQLQRIKPKYHIFGHIHEQGGEFLEKDGIKFYNVAKHYKIFNLNENEVKTVI